VSYSRNGKLVLLNCEGHLRFWDADSGVVRKEFPNRIGHALFSPDGRTLALNSHYSEEKPGAPAVVLWDPAGGKERRRLEHPPREQFRFVDMAFTPDGRSLWTLAVYQLNAGYVDATLIRRWDASTGKLLGAVDRKNTYAWSAAISPDGRTAAVPLMDNLLLVDIESDKDLATLRDLIPGGRPWHATFSSDGGFLIAGSLGGKVGIAEVSTRSVVARFSLSRMGNRKVAEWSMPKGNKKADLGQEQSLDQPTLEALAVSRDGRLVATSEAFDFGRHSQQFSDIPMAQIQIWEVATGKEVQRLTGFRSRCTSITFSPDGQRLASAFHNGTALIWDVKPIAKPLHNFTATELQGLWAELAAADAARAYKAMLNLVSAQEEAVPFLRQHLHPASAEAAQEVRRLLRGLDSDNFKEREASKQQLTALCSRYLPLLQESLRDATSLETKRRLEIILAGDARRLPPELLRIARSIQTLERIGSVEARGVLAELAKGAPGAFETQAAQESLWRLEPSH